MSSRTISQKKTLRSAIKKIIKANKGLTFHFNEHSVAFYKNININTPHFFNKLFEERKNLSFGVHFDSVVGHAHWLGVLRICSVIFTQQKDNDFLKYYNYKIFEFAFIQAKKYGYLSENDIKTIEQLLIDYKLCCEPSISRRYQLSMVLLCNAKNPKL